MAIHPEAGMLAIGDGGSKGGDTGGIGRHVSPFKRRQCSAELVRGGEHEAEGGIGEAAGGGGGHLVLPLCWGGVVL